MSGVTVTEKNSFDQVIAELPAITTEIRDKTAEVVLDDAKRIADDLPFDASSLVGSGSLEADEEAAIVKFSAGHAIWVEFGRDPGVSPNVGKVADWIMQNRGVTSRGVALRAARMFCARVKSQGLPPMPFLRPARAKGAEYLQGAGTELEQKLKSRVKT